MASDLFDLNAWPVAVTGAKGGIGRALCEGLTAMGAVVRALDLPDFDVCDAELKRCGNLAGLVNCAGVTRASWDETMAVNLRAVRRLCLEARELGAQSIVNLASLGAHEAFAHNVAYEVSKAGVVALTRALAKSFAPTCRVNCVTPGYIRTAMTESSWADVVQRERRSERTMLKRWGEPGDLVGPVAFLLSRASCYVTGTEVVVDGGWLANGL
jgi:NAD(P)-dependent dehydrogenase (short-subunit alcohol dehydrogenase family)